jgi:hypothetical protein
MTSRRVLLALALSLAGAPEVLAFDLSRAQTQLWTDVSAYPPKSGQMVVCWGFICRRRMEYVFTAADRKALTAIMTAGKASAAAERAAVQKAVIWFDRLMGPVLGTDRRVARADFRFRDDDHNYDCWDTTRNVTALLLIMQDWGLLKHHRVGDPVYRGNALVLQTPHNTPIIVDNATRVQWTVDLWTRGYGQAPEVLTAEEWVKLD